MRTATSMSPSDPSDAVGAATPVAHTNNSSEQQPGGTIVDSLGEALAGMNLPSSSGPSFAAPAPSAPFSLAPGSTAVPATSDDGWGNYADAAQAAFQVPTGKRDTQSPTESHLRNESIELFLSQSPSQTLGDDVFKFSHTNLPALATQAEEERAGDTGFRMSGQTLAPGPPSASKPSNNAYGNMGTGVQENPRRRTDSPSCSATGTTTSSRSVSPYAASDVGSRGGTISAFRYDSSGGMQQEARSTQPSFAEDDTSGYSNNMSQAHGSHPSIATMDSGHRSPFNKDRTHVLGGNPGATPYEASYDSAVGGFQEQTQPAPAAPQMAGAANGQQPQVLYMAVPSPDGRGQVLQPVQMVQLPNKNYSYVMPGAAGGAAAGVVPQPVMVDGTQQQQPMMVLPPLPNQHQEYATTVGADGGRGGDRNRVSNNANSRQYDVEDYNKPLPRSTSNSGMYQTVTDATGAGFATPQRPPLDALLGQVRRLSRDQVGCRLVQQALDEEGPMAATLILNEGLPFWGEAMVDPFGNYLFQKILEKITAEERVMLLKSVSMRIVNASLNLHGTRSVQKVVELCALDLQNTTLDPAEESAADILTQSLAPAAARLCIDSHGNHVIQRILLKLGHKHSQFVFDAVAASVGDVARHRHGCCVIQRCLDSPRTEARSNLVDRIVNKSLELMQDAYGNYVVQYVLDVCADDHVQAVCASVVGKVNLLAIQKFSSNVMEKCLERCNDRTKELYVQEMSDPNRVRELMMDPFGNYVVQRALSVSSHTQAIRLVEAMRPHLVATQTTGPNGQRNGGVRNTAGGRRIIAKICRRFPNFTLNDVESQDELYGQNKGIPRHHQQQQQAPVVAAGYGQMSNHNQMGSHLQMGAQMGQMGVPQQMSHYGADPHMSRGGHHIPMQQQQQQQSYYNVGSAPAYYEHATGGHGAYQYQGM